MNTELKEVIRTILSNYGKESYSLNWSFDTLELLSCITINLCPESGLKKSHLQLWCGLCSSWLRFVLIFSIMFWNIFLVAPFLFLFFLLSEFLLCSIMTDWANMKLLFLKLMRLFITRLLSLICIQSRFANIHTPNYF